MALMSVDEALARVIAGVEPLPAENVPIAEAFARVLARDLAARRTQPPAAVSAMDGYAVRSADVATTPARLTVIGEVAAGRPFVGPVGPGQATRIFTGGVLPDGTDTVVIQELARRDGQAVTFDRPTQKGRNVRVRGLDFSEGEVLIKAGTALNARAVALAAAMNHPIVPVHRRPRIAILATGDELKLPGSALAPGEIISSNAFALAALARAEGAEATDLGIVPDRLDETIKAVKAARASGVDILITAGGASVGDHDLVQPALAAEGMELAFWRIAMRPGKPLLYGRLGPMHVLGVPGNPVSAYVCALLFLLPLLRRLTGRSDLGPDTQTAMLGRDLPANDERADYLRSTLARGPDGLVATPAAIQDSSMVATLARADCLVIRAPFAEPAAAGSPCTIIRLAF